MLNKFIRAVQILYVDRIWIVAVAYPRIGGQNPPPPL